METDRNRFVRAASRRTFLKSGMAACAAGAMTGPVSAPGRVVPYYYKAVFDNRFHEPRLFAAEAAARRIPTAAIQGNVTNLFFDDLDLRWKQGPVRLTGLTTPAALFCLDLLARDRGMRVTHRVTNPGVETALEVLDNVLPRRAMITSSRSSNASELVFWVIAPSPRPSAKETVNA
jgi:hypothetical protein